MSENTSPEKTQVDEQATPAIEARRQRRLMIGLIAGGVLLVIAIGAAIYGLTRDPATTATIRDIFIIFLAFESLLIGAALVILILQIASLINLIQNEVKPILKSTSETVNTLRGTTQFLSENLVEPVIKLNAYLAGLRKILDFLKFK